MEGDDHAPIWSASATTTRPKCVSLRARPQMESTVLATGPNCRFGKTAATMRSISGSGLLCGKRVGPAMHQPVKPPIYLFIYLPIYLPIYVSSVPSRQLIYRLLDASINSSTPRHVETYLECASQPSNSPTCTTYPTYFIALPRRCQDVCGTRHRLVSLYSARWCLIFKHFMFEH